MDANDMAVVSIYSILERVGRNIEEHRERAGLTQKELAERAGVDRAFLNKVEHGSRNTSLIFLAKLARAMNVAASALMHGV